MIVRLRANARVPAEPRDIIAHPASGTCTHAPATLSRGIRNACLLQIPSRRPFASGLAAGKPEHVFLELKMSFDQYHYLLYVYHVFPMCCRNAAEMRT